MPGTTTGRWALPYVLGADAANTIDTTTQALAEKLRDEGVQFSQGVFASRPTSTPGSPGKTGRVYYATDTDQLFWDFGTGWKQMRPDESVAAYRTIAQAGGGASTFATVPAAADNWFTSGGYLTREATDVGSQQGPMVFYLDDADYAIPGRTMKLRVRAQCLVNSVATGATLTVGLFPLSSVAGAADNFQATLGAVAAGSTVAFASPGANSTSQNNSGDFAFPSDGYYVLGATSSANIAVQSRTVVSAQLQLHWV